MKYRLGSLIIEAIDVYVRVTVAGGPDEKDKVAVTQKQCPNGIDVATLVAEMRGCWPDNAVLQACSRAAEDARNNKIKLAL